MNNGLSPYPKLRQAYGEKIDNIKQLLANKNIDTAFFVNKPTIRIDFFESKHSKLSI